MPEFKYLTVRRVSLEKVQAEASKAPRQSSNPLRGVAVPKAPGSEGNGMAATR